MGLVGESEPETNPDASRWISRSAEPGRDFFFFFFPLLCFPFLRYECRVGGSAAAVITAGFCNAVYDKLSDAALPSGPFSCARQRVQTHACMYTDVLSVFFLLLLIVLVSSPFPPLPLFSLSFSS